MSPSTRKTGRLDGGSARAVTVGLAGYGYWGPKLARVLSSLPDCAGVRVWDVSPAARAAARAVPGLSVAGSWEELLGDPEVKAVAIATPPESHYRLARAAISGGKHVFVEKPFTLSLADARALASAARAMKRVLMSGHVFLYSPSVRRVADIVEKGRIGRLLSIESRRCGPRSGAFSGPGADVIWDMLPHDVSIALRLAARMPLRVGARLEKDRAGRGSSASVRLTFPGGLTSDTTLSWLSPDKVRLTTVTGTSGRVVYDDTDAAAPVTLHPAGEPCGTVPGGGEPLALECGEFLRAARAGAVPLSSGDFGVRVVRIVEAAALSASLGGEEVAIP